MWAWWIQWHVGHLAEKLEKMAKVILVTHLREHVLSLVHQLCHIKIWLEFQLLMDVGITAVYSNSFQNVPRSQFCNTLIMVGLKILQEQNQKFIQAVGRRPRISYPLLVIVHFIILAVQSRDNLVTDNLHCPQHHKEPEQMARFFSTFGGESANIFLEDGIFFWWQCIKSQFQLYYPSSIPRALLSTPSSDSTDPRQCCVSHPNWPDLCFLHNFIEDNDFTPTDTSWGSGPRTLSMPFSTTLLFLLLPQCREIILADCNQEPGTTQLPSCTQPPQLIRSQRNRGCGRGEDPAL